MPMTLAAQRCCSGSCHCAKGSRKAPLYKRRIHEIREQDPTRPKPAAALCPLPGERDENRHFGADSGHGFSRKMGRLRLFATLFRKSS